jgi:hypothetical protein
MGTWGMKDFVLFNPHGVVCDAKNCDLRSLRNLL